MQKQSGLNNNHNTNNDETSGRDNAGQEQTPPWRTGQGTTKRPRDTQGHDGGVQRQVATKPQHGTQPTWTRSRTQPPGEEGTEWIFVLDGFTGIGGTEVAPNNMEATFDSVMFENDPDL